MAVEKPNKDKFTFWANMRETIEQNEDVELKYKLYSALTNYGLYGIEPDENDKDYGIIMMLLQSMKLTIDKSKEVSKQKAEAGAAGGAQQRIYKEDIEKAIVKATKDKNGVPTKQQAADAYFKIFGQKISTRALDRVEYKAPQIFELAQKVLNGTYRTNATNETKADICLEQDK